jgi:hypothetical protein
VARMNKSRRSGRYLFIFFFILFFLFSGCISEKAVLNQEALELGNKNESWTTDTINRLESSYAIDGGYSDFPPEEPTLYSTYYFLESLKLLSKEPKYKQATIDWLLLKEKEMAKQNTNSSIRDIYFLTMSLNILGAKPANSSNLISKVMELQKPDGSFTEQKGGEGTLLDTFRAINILYTLGVDLNQIPLTKAWLIDRWTKPVENDDLINLTSETPMLLSALEFCNVNISSPQNQSPRMENLLKQRRTIEEQLKLSTNSQMDLFTLSSFTDSLLITGNISSEIRSDIGMYLKERQLEDGGFNALLDNYGEEHGTYLALKIASNIALSFNDNVSVFIYSHEPLDENGGFRPSYRLISSPENTYLAVKSLKILGLEPSHKEELFKYVKNDWSEESKNIKSTYNLLMIYNLLNQPYPEDTQFKEMVKTIYDESANQSLDSINLEEVLYLTKVANLLNINLDNKNKLIGKLQSTQQKDGGFGYDASDLYMTFYVVSILKELGSYPLAKDECISWIQDGQINDGGFIIRRGSIHTNSSDIYSTYMSMVSLNNLDAKPKNPEKLTKWIKDCQDEHGGFRLAPKYADLDASESTFKASLEYTSWGLITSNILSEKKES